MRSLETGYTFGPVDDEASLIEAGFVDSVNIVGLTLELETRLGIQIPASEMTPETWTSVRSITAMCTRIQMGCARPQRWSLSKIIFGSRSMVDQMRAEIARARRHAHAVSFVVLKLGQAVGDPDSAVLSETWLEVGKLIAGILRLEDSVSLLRLPDDGGGALLGLLPHATDRSVMAAVRRIGRLLLDGFGNRYDARAFRYGVATFPVDGAELEDLIQKATGTWYELDQAALASDEVVAASNQGAVAE